MTHTVRRIRQLVYSLALLSIYCPQYDIKQIADAVYIAQISLGSSRQGTTRHAI